MTTLPLTLTTFPLLSLTFNAPHPLTFPQPLRPQPCPQQSSKSFLTHPNPCLTLHSSSIRIGMEDIFFRGVHVQCLPRRKKSTRLWPGSQSPLMLSTLAGYWPRVRAPIPKLRRMITEGSYPVSPPIPHPILS